MRAKLKEIKGTPRRWKMHEPLPEQGQWLAQILTGWLASHAAPTNFRALQLFRDQATQLWRRALSRRGQRAVATWDRMRKIANELDCQSPQSFTHGQRTASPSNTRGRSRMRESGGKDMRGGARKWASPPRTCSLSTLRLPQDTDQ